MSSLSMPANGFDDIWVGANREIEKETIRVMD
jgi:hypothetical protein